MVIANFKISTQKGGNELLKIKKEEITATQLISLERLNNLEIKKLSK